MIFLFHDFTNVGAPRLQVITKSVAKLYFLDEKSDNN